MARLALLACVLLAVAPPPGLDRQAADLMRLRTLDQRVVSLGYRLAVAARGYCTPAFLPGIAVDDRSAYGADSQAAARRAFGLEQAPQILAVAEASPAQRAGLRAGDALLAIDAQPIPTSAAPPPSFDRIERIDSALERATAAGILRLTIRRETGSVEIAIPLDRGCASRFVVEPIATSEAEADGRYVLVSAAYADRAQSDDALAIVLAHELAHNILGHRARLERAGVHYGIAQHFGRNARLIRATELEADRLSLFLIAAAGFDPDAAIAFRARQWRGLDQALLRSANHPSPEQRLAALRDSRERLRSGAPFVPDSD